MRRSEVQTLATAFALLFAVAASESATAEPARGLILQLERGSARDARVSRLAALAVPRGSAASSARPPGRFRAVLRGTIAIELFDDYTFSFEGRGRARLEINGETVLEGKGEDLLKLEPKTIEIDAGAHALRLEYEPPPSGDASLRVLLASFDFAAEPIHPSLLSHDSSDALLVKSELARRGRELIDERRCARCHVDSSGAPPRPAPSLADAGARFHATWLARWIEEPRSLRPDASMPRVFRDDASRARDVAAYLASLGKPRGTPGLDDGGLRERGARLADALGCIGCHVSGKEPGDTAPSRISHEFVREKWRPAALVDYLRDPARFHPGNPMPNFKLNGEEARALAAHLLSESRGRLDPVDFSGASIERGRELVASSGCLDCHELEGVRGPTPRQSPLPSLGEILASARSRATGCLSPETNARVADFGLTDREVAAIGACAAASSEAGASLAMARRGTPAEYARRELERLRCGACHQRDGVLDAWSRFLPLSESDGAPDRPGRPGRPGAEAAKLLQLRPLLTWTGEKLRGEWLTGFLRGERPVVRPWLEARMPVFALDAGRLAAGLALEHGVIPGARERGPIDPELVEIGAKLIGAEGGFSCVTCHDQGETRATGEFDAKGANFDAVTKRLRVEFYRRWMRDPLRLDPRTKMPQFINDGRTAIGDVLDGDATRQLEAIWHALRRMAR